MYKWMILWRGPFSASWVKEKEGSPALSPALSPLRTDGKPAKMDQIVSSPPGNSYYYKLFPIFINILNWSSNFVFLQITVFK